MISATKVVLVLLRVFQAISCNCLLGIEVYGPGWETPSLVLPSRYFFIKYPEKCHQRVSKVVIESINDPKGCRSKQQVFHDTMYKNGLSVVRYRLLDKVCEQGLRITLQDEDGREVRRQETNQVIVDEDCLCPDTSFNHRMKCDSKPDLYQRIDDDLKVFQSRNESFKTWLEEAKRRFASFPRSYSFCHYKILDQKVCQPFGQISL